MGFPPVNGLTHSSQPIRRRTGAGGGLDEYQRYAADGHNPAAAQPASLCGQNVMSKRAAVTAEVTFLRTADGGRKTAPILNSGKYMPHIVVQDQAIRKAIVDEDRVCRELYQGVRFIDGP